MIVAIALAPAGVLAIVQAADAVRSASRSQFEIIEARALATVDARRAALVEIRESIRVTAVNLQREMTDTGQCDESLDELRLTSPWLRAAVVFDRNGHASCGSSTDVDISDTESWQDFIQNPRYTMSAARTGRLSGKQVLIAYRAFEKPVADAVALGASIDVSYLNGISPLDTEDLQVQARFTMIDVSGRSITEDEDIAAEWLPVDRLSLQSYGDRQLEMEDAEGKTRIFYVSAIAPGQLWAVTGVKAPSFWTAFSAYATLSVLAPILIWIIAIGVAYFAIDTLVTRHIAALRRAAMRIGEGDLNAPVGRFADAPSEIKALGRSIRGMRDKIADREEELQATLELQHRLLLEVHHRVKNNLQTISSMINLESGRVQDPNGKVVMEAIQSRIHSLAMVHQNLYAAERLEEVSLDQLTRDIAEHLEDSLGPVDETSITALRLEEVTAPPILATPIALFLSEALGNAFKHAALPPDIQIDLTRADETFSITVSNRLGEQANTGETTKGLGLSLMKGFSKQIAGELVIETQGDRFSVSLTSPLPNPETNLFSVRSRDDREAAE